MGWELVRTVRATHSWGASWHESRVRIQPKHSWILVQVAGSLGMGRDRSTKRYRSGKNRIFFSFSCLLFRKKRGLDFKLCLCFGFCDVFISSSPSFSFKRKRKKRQFCFSNIKFYFLPISFPGCLEKINTGGLYLGYGGSNRVVRSYNGLLTYLL